MLQAIKILLVTVVVVMVAVACGAATDTARVTQPAQIEPLTIYGWAGYMPQGILDDFEVEFGVPVDYRIYGDPEEALDGLRAGERYDVVVLGDTSITQAITEGLLAELNYEQIPNFRNLGANFRDLAYDPENRYSVMIQWGTTGLIGRTDRLAGPLTAWNDLWNPAYAGRIVVWPYQQDLIGIALKSLGYSMNSEDPVELAAAAERLMTLSQNVSLLDPNLGSGADSLLDDKTAIIYGWAYDARNASEQLDTAVYVLPKEGTLLWTDSVAVPTNSLHKSTAEQFINYLLRPEVGAKMVNELWISSPNEAARRFVNPEILSNPLVYPPREQLQNAEFFLAVSAEAQAQRDEIWKRFLTAQGAFADGLHSP